MGSFLSVANTDLSSEEGSGNGMKYCVGEIQGWRRNMEDAHLAALDLKGVPGGENMSMFGVFDGHGGKEVAKFVQIKFIREYLKSKGFREENFADALRETFHRIDDMLENEKYDAVLQTLKSLPNPSDVRKAQENGEQLANAHFDATSSEYDSDDDDELMTNKSALTKKNKGKKKMTKLEVIKLFKQLIEKETNGGNTLENTDDDDIDEDDDDDEDEGEESTSQVSKSAKGQAEWDAYYLNNTRIPGDRPRPSLQIGPASENHPSGPVCTLRDHRVQAGCTSVVVFKLENTLYCANAGDSRAVLCRGDGIVHALSEDHKPSSVIESSRIEKAGGFVNVNGRINGNLNLSRSIGDMKYKQVPNLMPSDQMITAEPDITKTELSVHDKYIVIACDGVWDVFSNQEICDFISARLYPSWPLPQGIKAPIDETTGKRRTEPMDLKTINKEVFDHCITDDPKRTSGIGADNMTCMIILFS